MKIPRLAARWFRFTLREVLLLILAAGLGAAWYREYRAKVAIRDAAAPIIDAVTGLRAANQWSKARAVTSNGEYDGIRFMVTAGLPEWWTIDHQIGVMNRRQAVDDVDADTTPLP
jgi:hypothetical protein